MNRKNLVGLKVAVAATIALCGCASAAAPRHTPEVRQSASGALEAARNAWTECVRTAIPGVEDPQSSSEVVARAAMKHCSAQYTDMLRVLASTFVPTCSRDSDCTRSALAKAQREATQAATDEVVTARIRVAGAQVLKCQ